MKTRPGAPVDDLQEVAVFARDTIAVLALMQHTFGRRASLKKVKRVLSALADQASIAPLERGRLRSREKGTAA